MTEQQGLPAYGVGAAWIESGMRPGSTLLTIEPDPDRARGARAKLAGNDAIEVVEGDWSDALEPGQFDMLQAAEEWVSLAPKTPFPERRYVLLAPEEPDSVAEDQSSVSARAQSIGDGPSCAKRAYGRRPFTKRAAAVPSARPESRSEPGRG